MPYISHLNSNQFLLSQYERASFADEGHFFIFEKKMVPI